MPLRIEYGSAEVSKAHIHRLGMILGGGGHTLNLTLGNESFPGLTGPDEVMKALTRWSVSQKMRSAGRKPTWYK